MRGKAKTKLPPIECLHCGAVIVFPQHIISTQKYSGQFRCKKCGVLLQIKKVGIEIQAYKLIEKALPSEVKLKVVYDGNTEGASKPDSEKAQT
ncbi:MAG: hypothetical protein MUO97_07375 [Dehalococcoidia bacterium]|nr:hypothetical protein [Dehalococcoidia bacterium]